MRCGVVWESIAHCAHTQHAETETKWQVRPKAHPIRAMTADTRPQKDHERFKMSRGVHTWVQVGCGAAGAADTGVHVWEPLGWWLCHDE